MLRLMIGVLGALVIALPAAAEVQPFATSFRTHDVQTEGATIHLRVGGEGPAVVLLHGLDNMASTATKLTMPVLAVGGEKSFGANEAAVMRNAAVDVTELVIPNAGHWLMEEQPAATIAAIRAFFLFK